MFYCYQYITVVQFVARVGTLIGEDRYGFAGEKWYTLFYCLQQGIYLDISRFSEPFNAVTALRRLDLDGLVRKMLHSTV